MCSSDLTRKARELAWAEERATPPAQGDAHWKEVSALCEAVARGNPEWGVPAYDGRLFSSDPEVSEVGGFLAELTLPDDAFRPALRDLLVDRDEGKTLGPVDFRSLGVREFGTIYEGLLESELSVAREDLALDRKGAFAPAGSGRRRAPVAVRAGEVYLHDRSGARKSSGSYYTPRFAVDHLLQGALDPALDDHFARLDRLDPAEAGERFFDFRVADIAMGSGHFLIAAVDRIEKRMAGYLARRHLRAVRTELDALRAAAREALGGELAVGARIEDGSLLRRTIARRCIYGVDSNPLAVELARLSVWIHTFVPGLPLSFLDPHLIRGNSLVGMATVEEVGDTYREHTKALFAQNREELLGNAREPLERLATISDRTVAEIEAAREAAQDVQEAVSETRSFFDLLCAIRVSENPLIVRAKPSDWGYPIPAVRGRLQPALEAAGEEMRLLDACHFPVAFPEVFLRDRPGFDVIVGNPPWEKAKLEEHGFWARHFPGLRGRTQREQEAAKERLREARPDLVAAWKRERAEAAALRKSLTSGPFPGMGKGDPDLYKAFCWRFWRLACPYGGRIGVVLPRSALAARGSREFRLEVLRKARDLEVTMLSNTGGWVFRDAEHRYTIGLSTIARGDSEATSVSLRGPFASRAEFDGAMAAEPVRFYGAEVENWNDTASLPLLPSANSARILASKIGRAHV